MKDYDQAISLKPKFYSAYNGRGYVFLKYKLYVQALKEFTHANELNPDDLYALDNLQIIYTYIKEGGLKIEEYDNLIQSEPAKAEYYLGRAKSFLRMNNLDNEVMDSVKSNRLNKIIDDAAKAIEINPNFAEAHFVKAIGYCGFGRRKESKAEIEKYDKLTGKITKEICLININSCFKDDEECLLKVFTGGISNPSEIGFRYGSNSLENYHHWRGIIYYKRGKLDGALSDFNAQFSLSNHTEYSYRGNIYLKKGKYEEALSDFYRSQGSAESLYGIGEIKFIKREYQSALDFFNKAIFLNPRLSKAYLGRGTVYLEFGKNFAEYENNEEKSIEFYRKAVKEFDDVIETELKDVTPEVYLRRAKAYEKLGEQAKADADRTKI